MNPLYVYMFLYSFTVNVLFILPRMIRDCFRLNGHHCIMTFWVTYSHQSSSRYQPLVGHVLHSIRSQDAQITLLLRMVVTLGGEVCLGDGRYVHCYMDKLSSLTMASE